MLSIYSSTKQEFSAKIYELLGKGKRHAALLYQQWMRKGALSLDKIEPQAQALAREILAKTDFSLPEVSALKEDGETKKFLLKFADGRESESVIIPMESGITLCISSQVGCKMGCAFCETGRMGLIRSLKTEEIIAQVFIAKFHFKAPVRNIVFMGMGEPLDNFEAVMQAIRVLMDWGFGPSRITVSTSGVVPGIYRLMAEADPALNLAVSVNAPTDVLRNRLMPVNRKWDMAQLKKAMMDYCLHPRRAIFGEYVLMKDVNDSLECADILADYLQGLRVKINLIPYNAQSRDRFAPPSLETQEAFMQRLREKGYQTLLRHHKGRRIMAACGQLGNLGLRYRSNLSSIGIGQKEDLWSPKQSL